MATLKTANGNGKYSDTNAKENVISYILNPYKAKQYSGNMHITDADPIADMERISRQFGKEKGIQLRHFIISFDPQETTDPRVVAAIACEIIPYLGREYQLVFAVHEDKPHLHIHIVCNSVSYVDGHRYYGTRQEFNGFKAHIKQVLRRYGIQTLQYVPNRMRNPEF